MGYASATAAGITRISGIWVPNACKNASPPAHAIAVMELVIFSDFQFGQPFQRHFTFDRVKPSEKAKAAQALG